MPAERRSLSVFPARRPWLVAWPTEHGARLPIFRDCRPGRNEARVDHRRDRSEHRRCPGIWRSRDRQIDRDTGAGCDPDTEAALCTEECRRRQAPRAKRETRLIAVPIVDLPLGATEDRVAGALDLERALTQGIKAFEPGLLARASRFSLHRRGQPAGGSPRRPAARRRRVG